LISDTFCLFDAAFENLRQFSVYAVLSA